MAIHKGRWTAQVDDDIVVFLIGMRINRPWKVRAWWPVFTAMPRMVRWLQEHPQEGLLHVHQLVNTPISPVLIQYWRSFDDLDRFARSPDAPHLEAWKRFNATVRDSGDVGIWHETYQVPAGHAEAVFGNMPRRGLAAATGFVPVGSTAAAQTAAVRIGAREAGEDRPPVAGY